MLNNNIKLKDIFDTFIYINNTLDRDYKYCDKIVKNDMLFNSTHDCFAEFETHLEDRDNFKDLIDTFIIDTLNEYKYKEEE